MTPAQGPRVSCAEAPRRRPLHWWLPAPTAGDQAEGSPACPPGEPPPPRRGLGCCLGTEERLLSREEALLHPLTNQADPRGARGATATEGAEGPGMVTLASPPLPVLPAPGSRAGPCPALPAPLTLALSKRCPKQTDRGERAVPRSGRLGLGLRPGPPLTPGCFRRGERPEILVGLITL